MSSELKRIKRGDYDEQGFGDFGCCTCSCGDTFLFSEFPGVDFTSIDDLSFRINGVLAGDYSVSLVETRYHDDLVPEPVTMAALMMGIGGLGGYIRRRRR